MAKGLNRREKAVHNALARYNAAALALGSSRTCLEFKELTDYAYLGNFDFLKYSEHGAQDTEWSRPANRRCAEAWQKIQHAKEEIVRLNVEVRRVQTHIRDEDEFLSRQYDITKAFDPNLAHALLTRIELVVWVNQRILRDLNSLSKLKGFSSDLTYGTPLKPFLGLNTHVTSLGMETVPSTAVTEGLGDIHQEEQTASAEVVELEPSDEVQYAMLAIEQWKLM
jgi:hypothetical protein